MLRVSFGSFQTKHGFDIRIGPVSLTSLDKDTPLVRVGFRQVPFFFNCNKSASELGIIQKTKKKTKIRLTLMTNCLTKAYEN